MCPDVVALNVGTCVAIGYKTALLVGSHCIVKQFCCGSLATIVIHRQCSQTGSSVADGIGGVLCLGNECRSVCFQCSQSSRAGCLAKVVVEPVVAQSHSSGKFGSINNIVLAIPIGPTTHSIDVLLGLSEILGFLGGTVAIGEEENALQGLLSHGGQAFVHQIVGKVALSENFIATLYDAGVENLCSRIAGQSTRLECSHCLGRDEHARVSNCIEFGVVKRARRSCLAVGFGCGFVGVGGRLNLFLIGVLGVFNFGVLAGDHC